MAVQERAVRTRRAVLEAAAAVFAERGYAAATINEILTRSGVTKGALYFHFASKEELAKGVLDAQVLQTGLPPQASTLQEWVDVGMALAHRLPREPLLQAGARLSGDPEVHHLLGPRAWTAWADLSAQMLSRAQQRGEALPHVVPVETAQLMVAAWSGVQAMSLLSSGWGDLEGRVAALFDHMLPYIATPGLLGKLDTAPDRGARLLAQTVVAG